MVPLAGGLGNQLFQYYAGFTLGGERPLIDISLGAPRENREGEVDLLELCPDAKNDLVTPRIRFLHGLARKSFGYCMRISTTSPMKKRLNLHRILLTISASTIFSLYFGGIYKVFISSGIGNVNRVPSKLPGRTILIGYFQTQSPFGDSEKISLDSFIDGFKSISSTQQLESRDLSDKKNLVIHVRLSDYLNEPKIGCLSNEYFKESITSLGFAPQKILLFSDDEKMAESEIKQVTSIQTEVFASENLTSTETLLMMGRASNLIISNSSFSWWAATLATKFNNATIIAPNKWFAQQADPKLLIPTWWKRTKAIWR